MKRTKKLGRALNRRSVIVWGLAFLLNGPTLMGTSREQTKFSADISERIMRPARLPDAVLQILSKDDTVAACLKDNTIPSGGSLASWFTASEVHLNGPNEADLIVLPVAPQGDVFMCFHSVEGIGWFWVLSPTGGRYKLVLKTAGLRLAVLNTAHNGYRDIRSESQVGRFATTLTFWFEGGRYQQHRKNTTELH